MFTQPRSGASFINPKGSSCTQNRKCIGFAEVISKWSFNFLLPAFLLSSPTRPPCSADPPAPVEPMLGTEYE